MRTLLLVPFLLSSISHAQKKVEVERQMSISYGSPSWNTDPTKIDSAFLILRDRATTKLVQIQLEETEPDSSEFVGHFALNLNPADKVLPEIFVPPQNQRSEADYKKLYQDIQGDKLPRKPVIWKKNARGRAMLDVYDTREQAETALKAYQDEQRLAHEMSRRALVKPATSEQNLAAAQQAERKAALDKLAMEAAKRETDRIRLEQIEKQKAEERERAARALSEQEKSARRAAAAAAAASASEFYAAGDYVHAEQKFREAVELNPEDHSYYFKYGVSLYRNQKFNEALVVLKTARVAPEREAEKKYFLGLAHYRLNEFDASLKHFGEVIETKDPQMAPSALFYTGMVQFAREQYDPAKKSFETVIDTSQDSAMDAQAEEYLERIANAMLFAKMREKMWSLSAVVGVMYDSNVLLAPDNAADQGTATNIGDVRLLTAAELGARPVFNQHHEWQVTGSANLTNSSKNSAAKADPWFYNVTAPYSYKGVLFNKGYRFTLKPAFETLYMAIDGGTKTNVLRSGVVTLDNTFVMTRDWFSTYSLEWRADDASGEGNEDDNNSDANKYALRTVQALFLDKAKKSVVMGNLGFVVNAAKGANRKYQRYEMGANLVRPTSWNASWSAGLNAYQARYQSADPRREDLNVTLSAGLSKPVREWVTWGVLASFTRNNSNQDAYSYSKYLLLTTATFNTAF